MPYLDVINKVSKKLSLSAPLVDKVYKAYWLYIKQYIQTLPLKENIGEDEFAKLKTNFNIPSLGKLYITWDKFIKDKKNFETIKRLKEYVED